MRRWINTLLLRMVDLRRADPEVVAAVKRELESFNRRTRKWSDKTIPLSDTSA